MGLVKMHCRGKICRSYECLDCADEEKGIKDTVDMLLMMMMMMMISVIILF